MDNNTATIILVASLLGFIIIVIGLLILAAYLGI
jgi:hypothetical protein